MANLSDGYVNILVEKLIRTVSRAFYTDGVVVVLDAFIREKYIREEELGPRLRLQDKEVRKIINKLEDEMLVHCESILMEDLRQSKCYYIDYQMFVDVVRYRVYLMDKAVNSSQNEEINETKYKCPTCAKEVNSLEAQKCKSKDYKFICTSCCPHENFRELMAEASYRLVPMDIGNKVRNAASIKTKLLHALQSSPEHDGIFDILRDLKDATMKRNLPSENMGRGFRNSEVVDEDKKQAILDNLGRPVLSKKNRFLISEHVAKKESGISISLEDKDNSIVVQNGVYVATVEDDKVIKKLRPDSMVPEFLTRSGVHGASTIYQLESLQAPSAGTAVVDEQPQPMEEAEGEDIAWEDADDDGEDDE